MTIFDRQGKLDVRGSLGGIAVRQYARHVDSDVVLTAELGRRLKHGNALGIGFPFEKKIVCMYIVGIGDSVLQIS